MTGERELNCDSHLSTCRQEVGTGGALLCQSSKPGNEEAPSELIRGWTGGREMKMSMRKWRGVDQEFINSHLRPRAQLLQRSNAISRYTKKKFSCRLRWTVQIKYTFNHFQNLHEKNNIDVRKLKTVDPRYHGWHFSSVCRKVKVMPAVGW